MLQFIQLHYDVAAKAAQADQKNRFHKSSVLILYPTVIRSWGRRALLPKVLERAAKIRVSPPTRPKNINAIKIRWEMQPKCGVTPRDRPTVPMRMPFQTSWLEQAGLRAG